MKRNAYSYILFMSCMLLCAKVAHSQVTLRGLGFFPGGGNSDAYSVSDDGSVVVGACQTSIGIGAEFSAFRWTASEGMINLGAASGDRSSFAYGVSGNGNVVVGESSSADLSQASRWTASTGMVSLGTTTANYATASSRNGDVIIGRLSSGSGVFGQAFRWTEADGVVDIGSLPPGGTAAYDISADGNIVVGASGGQAFRQTSSGMVGLGRLDGYASSQAFGVSSNGNVITGIISGSPQNRGQAFRWTPVTGMVQLGFLDGRLTGNPVSIQRSYAESISGDGNVIVGNSTSYRGTEAFIWTQTKGMASLYDTILNSGGISQILGWTSLDNARGISEDGTTIVGFGMRNGKKEAFVARSVSGWENITIVSADEPSSLIVLVVLINCTDDFIKLVSLPGI